MAVYYVWPDGTTCAEEHLEDYLQFMSDDYLTVRMSSNSTEEDVPSYDELVSLRETEAEVLSRFRASEGLSLAYALAFTIGLAALFVFGILGACNG